MIWFYLISFQVGLVQCSFMIVSIIILNTMYCIVVICDRGQTELDNKMCLP